MDDIMNYAIICRAAGQMDCSLWAQMDLLHNFDDIGDDTTG